MSMIFCNTGSPPMVNFSRDENFERCCYGFEGLYVISPHTTRSLDYSLLTLIFYGIYRIVHLHQLQRSAQIVQNIFRIFVAVISVVITFPLMIISLSFAILKQLVAAVLFNATILYCCMSDQDIQSEDLVKIDVPRHFIVKLLCCVVLVLFMPLTIISFTLGNSGIINHVRHFIRFHQHVGSNKISSVIFSDDCNDFFTNFFDCFDSTILIKLLGACSQN